ncbi:MAG TPA: hypothetical protein VFN29_13485 [Chiayiivirga sp.]|jgi:hypothetical protein|nr:hypothetical protein [Chiayiivirga sp.]
MNIVKNGDAHMGHQVRNAKEYRPLSLDHSAEAPETNKSIKTQVHPMNTHQPIPGATR